MKTAILFLPVLLTAATTFARPALVRPDLSGAIEKKLVRVHASGNGGHQGKCLKLNVTNLTGNQVLLTMDQGVIFRPDDTTEQDLTLGGMEMLTLAPFKSGTTDVTTFCAFASRGLPDQNDSFRYYKKGSLNLVKTLQFCKAKNILSSGMAQSAVWVITDNHSIESVYADSNPNVWAELIDLLANLTGQPKPQVFKQYPVNNTGAGPVFVPKPLKISAKFEVKLEAPATMTLGVYNEAGVAVQKVFEDRKMAGRKGYRFGVDFEAKNVPAGTYYIRLIKDAATFEERKVTVE